MGKYETKFKLKVVESFLAGEGGAKLLARRWAVPEEKIRTWVSHYRLHGVAALQPKRGAYTADFKLQVLAHQDRERLSSRQVAAIYDIRNPNQVVVWRRAFDGGVIAALEGERPAHPMKADKSNPEPPHTDGASSNRALREEVERLRAEVAYLKKIGGRGSSQSASRAERAQALLELRPDYPLPVLLTAAGLSRSTFYYQAKVLETSDKYAGLKSSIKAVYERHKGRYGYRRITAELHQAGQAVNHKTVQRLMNGLGLKSLVRPKRYRSYRGESAPSPNVLDRQFDAARPNEKWVTDVTEFNVRGAKLYLSPVMDLYNGEIVTFEMQERPLYSLVGNMLKKALSKLKGRRVAPLLHSDQGWHYQMPAYRRELSAHGLTQSMSRKGSCLDNAAMESFFGTLKSEFFYLNRFADIAELKTGLRRYIHYYNHQRIKLKLNGLSPVQYRTQAPSC